MSRAELSSGEARELVWEPGTDPVSQASMWVPERMYKWQMDILYDLMVLGARVSVVTPNESGKTSVLLPVFGLSFMAAFPGAQVVSTAGVERQIKENLWPVLKQSLRRYPKWRIVDDLEITAPGVRGMPGSTWKAFSTKDPDAAEGFHSRWYRDEDGVIRYAPLAVIIDEAKSFDNDDMFRAFQRCSPDVWLVISTPGEDTGPFYDCFHEARGNPWKAHEIGWHDCPHLREGFKLKERQEEIARLGENHPYILSWVFGKFFRKGAKYVFDDTEKVRFAMAGLIRRIRGPVKVALEFSGGGDEQVLGWRVGNEIMPLEVYRESDTTVLGDKFIDRFRDLGVKPEDITADNGGLGKPCIDYLERKGWLGIRRYTNNAKARDDKQFKSIAAEDHFEMRFRLSQGALRMPKDNKLETQMRRRRYEMPNDDSNRIRLEPKDKGRNRGEGSPDRLDTCAMLVSSMTPLARELEEAERKAGTLTRCPTPGQAHRDANKREEGTGFWASCRWED